MYNVIFFTLEMNLVTSINKIPILLTTILNLVSVCQYDNLQTLYNSCLLKNSICYSQTQNR